MHLTAQEIVDAVDATVSGALPELSVASVSTDTRAIGSGALFVALRGENFDGHNFLLEAKAQGAIAALVSSSSLEIPGLWQARVADTLVAYGRLARCVRDKRDGVVVGLTGSNGKTTTKELIAAAMGASRPVHKTFGNENNLVGVPKTLFSWPTEDPDAVIEMGMNALDEIAQLTRTANPDVALITNIGTAHVGELGSREAVASAKGELFEHLRADATAIVLTDDPLVVQQAQTRLRGQREVHVGRGAENDVVVSHVRVSSTGTQASLQIDGRSYPVKVPLPGEHFATLAGLAAGVVWALGRELGDALDAFSSVRVPEGRMTIHAFDNLGVTLINDAYNANLESVLAAMKTARDTTKGRLHVVVGDLLEQGDFSKEVHQKVGNAAVAHDVEHLYSVGAYSSHVQDGASALGDRVVSNSELPPVLTALKERLEPGDTVLIKGSRASRLERVASFLKSIDEGNPPDLSEGC